MLLVSDSLSLSSSDDETDPEGAVVVRTDDDDDALVVDVVEGLMIVLPVDGRLTSVSTPEEAVDVLLENCD